MVELLLFFVFVPVIASAQSKFGYYSHEAVLSALPEYAQAIEEFNSLKARCEAEIEHNEKELTRMYYIDIIPRKVVVGKFVDCICQVKHFFL